MALGEPSAFFRWFGRIRRWVGHLGFQPLPFRPQLFELALDPALLIAQRREAIARR